VRCPDRVVEQTTGREIDWINDYLDYEMVRQLAPLQARAQAAPTVLQSATSSVGLLTLVLSSTNASHATGVDNTYTRTAIDKSTTITLTGVLLGSHWDDWCGGNCTPPGPCLSPSLRGVPALGCSVPKSR